MGEEGSSRIPKTVTKLEYVGEDVGFMFQARKPMTRHARKVLERKKEAH